MQFKLKIYAFLAAIVVITAMISCKGSDFHERLITVSIEPQRKMLKEIVGDRFEVVTLVGNGTNPESFEPSLGQRLQLDKSMAFFPVGTLPFEEALEPTLSKDTKVYPTSKGIELIHGTHSHGHDEGDHHHSDADPHTWASVKNAKVMMKNMLDAVVEIDPENAAEYRSNYDKAIARLDSLDTAFAAKFAGEKRAFAVWHPSLSYFARDYGLSQVAVGQESKEASLQQLHSVIESAKNQNVKVFFFQKEFDSRQASSLNSEIGSRLVNINPMEYNWDSELSNIVDELTK